MRTGDKKTFKISMVDDEPDSLNSELNEIKEYLWKRHELELDTDKYEEAQEMMDNMDQTTDIAFVDKNLNGASGLDVIQNIRDKDKILDILIYSRAGIENNELAEMSSYGLVEAVQERAQIVDRLKTLIDKNLSKWEDVIFLRGAVISRIIEIEQEVDDTLMKVFSPHEKNKQKFRNFLLENPYISMFAKQTILEQLIKPMKAMEKKPPFSTNDLGDLMSARNLLAHSKRSEKNPKALVKLGAEKEITKSYIKSIFSQAKKFSDGLKSFREKQDGGHTSTPT